MTTNPIQHCPTEKYTRLSDFMRQDSNEAERFLNTPVLPRLTLPTLSKPILKMEAVWQYDERETTSTAAIHSTHPLIAYRQREQNVSEIETLKLAVITPIKSAPTDRGTEVPPETMEKEQATGLASQPPQKMLSQPDTRRVRLLAAFKWQSAAIWLLTTGIDLATFPIVIIIAFLFDEVLGKQDFISFAWLLAGLLAALLLKDGLRFITRRALVALRKGMDFTIT